MRLTEKIQIAIDDSEALRYLDFELCKLRDKISKLEQQMLEIG